jgi:hypothetical protein
MLRFAGFGFFGASRSFLEKQEDGNARAAARSRLDPQIIGKSSDEKHPAAVFFFGIADAAAGKRKTRSAVAHPKPRDVAAPVHVDRDRAGRMANDIPNEFAEDNLRRIEIAAGHAPSL